MADTQKPGSSDFDRAVGALTAKLAQGDDIDAEETETPGADEESLDDPDEDIDDESEGEESEGEVELEEEEPEPAPGQIHTVTVDGQKIQVPLDELIAG